MDRYNHYETAFAALLRDRRVSFVPIDESRRSYEGNASVKSLDFIIHGSRGEQFVVDVKGRKFPGGKPEKPKRTWECWATQGDVDDAQLWASKFGPNYRALFVFSYHLVSDDMPLMEHDTLWNWQDKRYLLRAIPVDVYAQAMKVRSPKWGTVYLHSQDFHRLVRPLHDVLADLQV